MKEIQLTLTVEEVNKILNALGNLPYIQVFEMISKIQTQADHQLNGKESNIKKTLIEN
jgi:hypothetical protein